MEASLFLLLPISLLLVIAIGAAFWWAIFAGQFDDTNEAAQSILLDDDNPDTKQVAGKDS
ncbi:cbb3-type cytochrome oxidase assembly protein CcoS [Pollutimonas sp. H1-120]|uniref:cbb3-type cytochrome oxidase assembly protein CcoS n=1 Tax=Pollutimonas sp. H1-120 TaxID=3148824 RepID=UPI003B5239FF